MKRLPLLAIVLGVGGLIPFFGLAAALLLFGTMGPVPHLGIAMLGYGAVILSFLGAVHWGLALEAPAIVTVAGTGPLDRRRLVLGAVPALWAWAALYVGLTVHVWVGITLVIAGLLATLAVERMAYRQGALPAGYWLLRVVLTAGAVLSLVAALVVPLEGYRI